MSLESQVKGPLILIVCLGRLTSCWCSQVLGEGSLPFQMERGTQGYFIPGQPACIMELERSEEDFIWCTWFYVRHRGLVRQGHLHVIEGRAAGRKEGFGGGKQSSIWVTLRKDVGMWAESTAAQPKEDASGWPQGPAALVQAECDMVEGGGHLQNVESPWVLPGLSGVVY